MVFSFCEVKFPKCKSIYPLKIEQRKLDPYAPSELVSKDKHLKDKDGNKFNKNFQRKVSDMNTLVDS